MTMIREQMIAWLTLEGWAYTPWEPGMHCPHAWRNMVAYNGIWRGELVIGSHASPWHAKYMASGTTDTLENAWDLAPDGTVRAIYEEIAKHEQVEP